jgi:hypothetical protein
MADNQVCSLSKWIQCSAWRQMSIGISSGNLCCGTFITFFNPYARVVKIISVR